MMPRYTKNRKKLRLMETLILMADYRIIKTSAGAWDVFHNKEIKQTFFYKDNAIRYAYMDCYGNDMRRLNAILKTTK